MKSLKEMSSLEKANKLESLLAICELELGYSSSVYWKTDSENEKRSIRILINNTREMFGTNRLSGFDYEFREGTIRKYNQALDEKLMMFPEYARLDDEDVTQPLHL